jgi:streptogramin lyase
MSRHLYVGTFRTAAPAKTFAQYDDSGSGSALWSKDTVGEIMSVAVDANENVYVAGASSSSITTRKYNNAGVQQWTANHGTTVLSIAVDSSGNVYTAGYRTSNITVRKYNSAGSLQWSVDTGTTAYGIAVDADGFVYVCGSYASFKNLHCYDSSGTLKWTKNVGDGAVCYSVACDSSGHLLVGTDWISRALYKLNLVSGNASAPSDAWYVAHGSIYGCAFDADGNCYCTGSLRFGYTTWKHNSAGSLIWSASHGVTTTGIAVDPVGNVYISGQISSSISVRKFDSGGGLLYSLNTGAIANCVALFVSGGNQSDIPPLQLPLALSAPYAARFIRTYLPSAPIGIDLGIPTAPEQRPPDLIDYPSSRTYRLYFPVGDGFSEWPLESLQCRRRLGASTWVTVVIPGWSAAMEAAVIAQVGLDLRIFAGAVIDGTEVLGEFLRAVITEYQVDLSPGAASITLTGRVQTPSYSAESRALIGVSERGLDTAGGRVASCAVVDPLIRPNDTVDDGESSWTAGAIVYRLRPGFSEMIVTERADG